MANISKSFHHDYVTARQLRFNASKPVMVVRLTKSGQPSRMAEDTKYFFTTEEAQEWIDRIQSLNPTRHYVYEIRTR